MTSRFKQFGASFGSKRQPNRNATNNQNTSSPTTTIQAAPPTGAVHTPTGSTSSTTSLPMNQQQQPNGLGRPPSYTFNPNAPRAQSPLPPQQQVTHHPPPINTGGYTQGHPALGGGAGGGGGGSVQPPGYGGGYAQSNGIHGNAPQPTLAPYGRGPPVEVEGAGRSKAQLIVGIDFVRPILVPNSKMSHLPVCTGDYIFWRCIRVCDKHGGERGHYHRVARCG